MLAGLTLLVLIIWGILSVGKFTDEYLNVFNTTGNFDQITPEEILGGWQTWGLGAYGVWLLVTVFCMLVRRIRDVGRGVLLPLLWVVFFAGSLCLCIMTSSENESIKAIGGLMIIATVIVGLVLLVFTLLGSKVVEGEEAGPSLPAEAWGVALVPWGLSVLLYFICVSSWVDLIKGCLYLEESETTALVHIKRAAESGNEVAKCMVLVDAVRKRDPEALPEVRQLAESGCAYWQSILSDMYSDGYPGLELNMDESLKWLKKAADQGNMKAIEKLQFFLPESTPAPEPPAPAAEVSVPAGTPAICTVCGGAGMAK